MDREGGLSDFPKQRTRALLDVISRRALCKNRQGVYSPRRCLMIK